ncbi:NucA/NucB deoxyribonuclease domain-containing protein [Paenibacillus thalictri]|uniref:Sporulation protein n=1 Tax=Paenibacillus thalictri TaxID=2527873 RepID=A0A4Q9DF52_9BACL|nr:NucA/NucB deoxyribonuclease domain-containing protein [Paenibacillus thalictri]TBL70438.1 sporulation protein [Paenibacillus thalictri]
MKKKRKKTVAALLFIVVFCLILNRQTVFQYIPVFNQEAEAAYTLIFPSDRYPETAAHIKDAIENGESSICTIDRKAADEHRKQSLKNVPTKKGYDRDEWPMAMCREGGANADIRYVSPADNRGAGSWVSNQLEKYPDGTKVKIVVK